MLRVHLTILLAAAFLAGCQPDPVAPTPKPAPEAATETPNNKIIKVKVSAAGDITADGQLVTPEELAPKLDALKEAGGGDWYYRENPEGDPHPNAMKVIQLVIERKMPIRLSQKPDYSDSTDLNGVSHPDPQE